MTDGQASLITDLALMFVGACLAARGVRRIRHRLFDGSFRESLALTSGIAVFG